MVAVVITSGGDEYSEEAASVLTKAFEADAVITYMLSSMSREARRAYRRKYFDALLTAATMNNCSFTEADDWKCCSVLMPPGRRVDNPWTLLPAGIFTVLWNIGFNGCLRMLWEYGPLADACKAKALTGNERHYYVFLVGTLEPGRGRGLCSAIMRRYQEIASSDQLPIWLEATSEKSMRLYLKLGWEIVDQMVLGKGIANADGEKCDGGEGVKIWGMIWRPESFKNR